MTADEALSPGEKELAAYEHDADFQHIVYTMDIGLLTNEILASLRKGLMNCISLLGNWAHLYPGSLEYLLDKIAKDPDVSLELAPAILGCSALNWPGPDAEAILAAAFPRLTGAYRDAAADRPGVRELLGLPEGIGYDVVPKPDPSWLWPKGKPYPPPDTAAGVQARLNYRGLGAGPVTGDWNDATQRAFARWQVSKGLPPTGELDEDSLEFMQFEGPDAD